MEREGTACRGVRGATTLDPAPGAADSSCVELLGRMLEANGASVQDVAAAIFTLDEDLAGENPAAAARAAGWELVPLLMVREHGPDDRVGRGLRVLLLVNPDRRQSDIRHVSLRGAEVLRPDLIHAPTNSHRRETT